MLQRAGRELLLLQASDWPFVIRSGGAVDYGTSRFSGHSTRFDRLTTIAEVLATGASPSPIEQSEVDEADLHDSIFQEIKLEWWG
jgi:1,4-alpha-glucan branching enzyme